jgi:hypothetical protein
MSAPSAASSSTARTTRSPTAEDGKGLITGLMLQWQDGKQVNLWPKEVAKGKLKFPSFIKVTSN